MLRFSHDKNNNKMAKAEDDLCNRQMELVLCEKINVSLGYESHKFSSHLSRVCDGNSRESIARLRIHHVGDRLLRRHDDRIDNETLLVFLFRKQQQQRNKQQRISLLFFKNITDLRYQRRSFVF